MLCGVVLSLAALAQAAGGDTLPPNKKIEGELAGEMRGTPWPEFVDSYYGYMTEHPVTLKAGGKITVSASVTGEKRRVALALLDPSGKIVAATKRNTDVGATRLSVGEVSASGKYQILIVSDRIGAYALTADYQLPVSEQTLQEAVDRAKKDLAEAEARLQEFRRKQRE
jgi:hypothetical protein